MITLLCSVRGCRQPLAREERRFVCPNRHSFDIARSGYVNLLQPQERRSKHPGDSKEAVLARRRHLERGFAEPLATDLINLLLPAGEGGRRPDEGRVSRERTPLTRRFAPPSPDGRGGFTLLDVGCGEGYYLGAMQRALGGEAHGVDISIPAIDAAAKRYRDCFFVVANADRFLPYADGSFDVVTSITSRMNPSEFRRVIRADGVLLIALPAPDDLIELRKAILGEAKLIDRTERTIDAFSPLFSLQKQAQWRLIVHLDRDAIHDVMASSYRGLRTKQRERLEALAEMDVTMSRDLLVFTCAPRPSPAYRS